MMAVEVKLLRDGTHGSNDKSNSEFSILGNPLGHFMCDFKSHIYLKVWVG